MCRELDRDATLYFRDDFRRARAAALASAEDYEQVLFSLERFGQYISLETGADSLSDYEKCILDFVKKYHPRDGGVSPDHYTSFGRLYKLVTWGRNDALHQGAKSRNLTAYIVRLSLTVEDSLMEKLRDEDMNNEKIKDYMVLNPTTAALWQPISFIRHAMLENSFTYLPVYYENDWHVITDYGIAKFLSVSRECRKKRLTFALKDALRSGKLIAEKAKTVSSDGTVADALKKSELLDKGIPLLVVRPCDECEEKELIGIVTAFDLL